MNEEAKKPGDRLEGLLRRWGAEEANARAQPPPAPAVELPPSPTSRGPAWGYLLAAAAGIIVGATAFYFYYRGDQREFSRAKSQLAEKSDQLAEAQARGIQLSYQLGQAQKDKAAVEGALAEAQQSLAARAEAQAESARLVALQQQLQSQKADADQAKQQLAEASGQLQAKQTELADAQKSFAQRTQAQKDLADAQVKQLQEGLRDQRAKLAAATAEIASAGESAAKARAEQKQVEAQLAQFKARHEAALASYQQAYLARHAAEEPAGRAAPAPQAAYGSTSLLARQEAARRNNMLQRYAQLGSSLRGEPARRLAATLEVLLTRLEMLDPADRVGVTAFGGLVRDSGLGERIDELLAAGTEPPEVRAWLMEARLILTGAERVS